MDEGTRDLGSQLNLPDTIQQPMTSTLCQFYLNIAWKTYRGVKTQARVYRDQFLKKRAQEYAAKEDGDTAKAVKQIRLREKLKRDYASIRMGYGENKQGLQALKDN